MRAWIPGLVGLVLVLSALAPGGDRDRVAAQDRQPEGEKGPAAVFRDLCADCHVTPDPGVATDRAFIRQLQETA